MSRIKKCKLRRNNFVFSDGESRMNTQVPSKKEMSSSNYSEDEGDWDEPENDKTVKFQSVVAPVKPERPKDPR